MLIHGADANNKMLPLLVDSSGRAIVVAPTNGMEVKPPFANFFPTYKSCVRKHTFNGALAAGTNYMGGAVVAAGFVQEIENVGLTYVGTTAGVVIDVYLWDGVNDVYIFQVVTPVSGTEYDRQGRWTMAAGDQMVMRVTGATLNDDAHMYISGRQFAVT